MRSPGSIPKRKLRARAPPRMTCIGMPNCSPFVLQNMEAEAILRLDARHEKRVHPSGRNTSQTPMSCSFLRVTNVFMQYFCNSLSAVLCLSLSPKWLVLDTAWCSSCAAAFWSLYSSIQRQIGKIFRNSLGNLRPTGAIKFLWTAFEIERSWSLTVHSFLFLCTPLRRRSPTSSISSITTIIALSTKVSPCSLPLSKLQFTEVVLMDSCQGHIPWPDSVHRGTSCFRNPTAGSG